MFPRNPGYDPNDCCDESFNPLFYPPGTEETNPCSEAILEAGGTLPTSESQSYVRIVSGEKFEDAHVEVSFPIVANSFFAGDDVIKLFFQSPGLEDYISLFPPGVSASDQENVFGVHGSTILLSGIESGDPVTLLNDVHAYLIDRSYHDISKNIIEKIVNQIQGATYFTNSTFANYKNDIISATRDNDLMGVEEIKSEVKARYDQSVGDGPKIISDAMLEGSLKLFIRVFVFELLTKGIYTFNNFNTASIVNSVFVSFIYNFIRMSLSGLVNSIEVIGGSEESEFDVLKKSAERVCNTILELENASSLTSTFTRTFNNSTSTLAFYPPTEGDLGEAALKYLIAEELKEFRKDANIGDIIKRGGHAEGAIHKAFLESLPLIEVSSIPDLDAISIESPELLTGLFVVKNIYSSALPDAVTANFPAGILNERIFLEKYIRTNNMGVMSVIDFFNYLDGIDPVDRPTTLSIEQPKVGIRLVINPWDADQSGSGYGSVLSTVNELRHPDQITSEKAFKVFFRTSTNPLLEGENRLIFPITSYEKDIIDYDDVTAYSDFDYTLSGIETLLADEAGLIKDLANTGEFKLLFDTVFPLSEISAMATIFTIMTANLELIEYQEFPQSKNIIRNIIRTNYNITGDPRNDYNPPE